MIIKESLTTALKRHPTKLKKIDSMLIWDDDYTLKNIISKIK